MNNVFVVVETKVRCLDFGFSKTRLFWFWRSRQLPLSAPWHIVWEPYWPRFVTRNYWLWEISVLSRSFSNISTPISFSRFSVSIVAQTKLGFFDYLCLQISTNPYLSSSASSPTRKISVFVATFWHTFTIVSNVCLQRISTLGVAFKPSRPSLNFWIHLKLRVRYKHLRLYMFFSNCKNVSVTVRSAFKRTSDTRYFLPF